MIEILSIDQPDYRAIAAAQLIMNELTQHTGSLVKSPEAYLMRRDADTDTLYALSQTESGLLAAAVVTHNNDGATSVRSLAVNPQARNNGHCRTLMNQIAEQAVTYGDSRIKLVPWGEGKEVYPRLGFVFDAKGEYMEASPQTVLATQASRDH